MPLSPWAKYQTFVHLTYYMIHPLMLAVVLLSVPVLAPRAAPLSAPLLVLVSVVIGLATGGPGAMLLYAQCVLDPRWLRGAWRLPTIMLIGVGVAWSTSLAVLGGLWGRDREFVRTPKFGIGPRGGAWHGKAYRGGGAGGGVVELALGLYCAWATWLAWRAGQYGAAPFLLLYTSGFLLVGALTVRQASAWPARGRDPTLGHKPARRSPPVPSRCLRRLRGCRSSRVSVPPPEAR